MKDDCIPLRQTKKRVWYHITTRNLGKEICLHPFIPDSCYEPLIPRICVAPTVGHCLGALRHSVLSYRYVYFTIGKAFYPKNQYEPVDKSKYPFNNSCRRKGKYLIYEVCDAKITEEKWLLKPTVFHRLTILSLDFLKRANEDFPNFEIGDGQDEEQKEFIKLVNENRRR